MPTKGDQRAKRTARAEMDRALDILDTAIGEVEKGEQY